MIKKLLSIVLTVCMIMSILVITPVSAGAPVVLDGNTQVMFDQSFGGHSGASDISDFSIAGSWNYMDHFMITDGGTPSIMSKENYDVSDAAEWTFTTKQSCTYNGYYIKLAYDDVNSKGYVLVYSRKTKTLALFKDTGYTFASIDNAVKYVSLDAYNTDVTITVNYEKATNTLKVSNSVNSNVITYTPDDGYVPSLNGKFGVEGANAGVFTVFDMNLSKTYDSVIVDQWKYDKTFSANDTIDSLKEEGYTFSNSDFTVSDSGLKAANNYRRVTFGPGGKDISGDYYFEAQVQRKTNTYQLEFNKTDKGFYRVWYGFYEADSAEKHKPWVRLQKYDASTGKTHTLVEIEKTSISAGHIRIYKGTVKNLDDGSVDIKIDIYNGDTLEHTLAYTDTLTDTVNVTQAVVDEEGNPVYEEDGTTQKTETIAVDTGAPLNSGKISVYWNYCGSSSYLKYLNAYSIGAVTEGTPVTYSKTVIDKTFSSADTLDSIKEEGFTTSSSSGVTTSFVDNYISFSGKTNTLIYTNADAINGTYSFSAKMKRSGNNYTSVYFNYKDSKNCYVLESNTYPSAAADKKLMLKKIQNGTTYLLDSMVITYAQGGGNVDTTVDVSVTENNDGSLTICTKWYNSNLTKEYTYTDSLTDMIDTDGDEVADTDTGAPITSGTIRLYQSYAASRVYSFKLIKYETVMEGASDGIPVFEGKFLSDNGAIKEITKGSIYFEYPTVMFGNYTVVAALYEDYKMTGIKTFEPMDLYSGKIELFDTTNSTAENMKIKVYFFDSGENLNLVSDEVYELK